MKLTNILFIFLLFLTITSCKKSTKTFYETGELKEKFYTNNKGEKEGLYQRFHSNGKIAEELHYVNGLRQETRKLFFEQGGLESESEYRDDKMNGYHKVYYPDGKLMIDSRYENNEIVGELKKYYKSGKIMEEVTYANNTENGPFHEYYENGKPKWKGTYLNGDNEFGLLEEYDQDGKLVRKMMCDSLHICRTFWHIDSLKAKG